MERDDLFGNTPGGEWVEELFTILDAGEWILANRILKDGVLDHEATSAQLKIPNKYNNQFSASKAFITGLKGIENEPIELTIEGLTKSDEISLSFNHEIGHYFLSMSGIEDHPNEEQFCEYFGSQMALYSKDLSVIGSVDGSLIHDLTELYNVQPMTVILQLINASKLPSRVVVDTMLGLTGRYGISIK